MGNIIGEYLSEPVSGKIDYEEGQIIV